MKFVLFLNVACSSPAHQRGQVTFILASSPVMWPAVPNKLVAWLGGRSGAQEKGDGPAKSSDQSCLVFRCFSALPMCSCNLEHLGTAGRSSVAVTVASATVLANIFLCTQWFQQWPIDCSTETVEGCSLLTYSNTWTLKRLQSCLIEGYVYFNTTKATNLLRDWGMNLYGARSSEDVGT